MIEELEQLLKNLRLPKMTQMVDDELRTADRDSLSHQEFLLRLLRSEAHDRQRRLLEGRIKRAKLPERWTLETFPYKLQPGVDRRKIRTLAELEFVPRAENIVFIGPTGVGKTGLASGILLKALENGYRCRFVRAQDLFDDMYASVADRSSAKLIRYLARLDVLLIDEMGYLNLKPEQCNIFFKLMEERYNRRSTLITTNLDYEEWQHFLGQRPMVDALLSRLRHRCQTLRIDGPSLRQPQG